jgi:hypothetical protein
VSALGEELRRLAAYEERHRRLMSRLVLLLIATVILDVGAATLMFLLERHARGSEIATPGQALFFTTVQLLTVSSQIKNPLTPAGRIVDVLLELWAVTAVAGSAGAIASFFQSGDAG